MQPSVPHPPTVVFALTMASFGTCLWTNFGSLTDGPYIVTDAVLELTSAVDGFVFDPKDLYATFCLCGDAHLAAMSLSLAADLYALLDEEDASCGHRGFEVLPLAGFHVAPDADGEPEYPSSTSTCTTTFRLPVGLQFAYGGICALGSRNTLTTPVIQVRMPKAVADMVAPGGARLVCRGWRYIETHEEAAVRRVTQPVLLSDVTPVIAPRDGVVRMCLDGMWVGAAISTQDVLGVALLDCDRRPFPGVRVLALDGGRHTLVTCLDVFSWNELFLSPRVNIRAGFADMVLEIVTSPGHEYVVTNFTHNILRHIDGVCGEAVSTTRRDDCLLPFVEAALAPSSFAAAAKELFLVEANDHLMTQRRMADAAAHPRSSGPALDFGLSMAAVQ